MGTSTWAQHLDQMVSVHLRAITCDCGVTYAIDNAFLQARQKDGKTFYCPNGCHRAYRETEADRERKKATKALAEADQARAEARRERLWRHEAEAQARPGFIYCANLYIHQPYRKRNFPDYIFI